MLQIMQLQVGSYQTNCYAVFDLSSKNCCLIDPGDAAEAILDELEKRELNVEAILLTHGHFDHVGAVKKIAAETGCKVYLHTADLTMPPMMTAGTLYYTDSYNEGDTLELAGLKFHVLHTPGHTPGSVCLMVEQAIFSGDTLFEGSCGRTDLPGGDWATITKSLARLAGLELNYRVFPGHGRATTLAEEKLHNPYMR